MSKNPDPTRRWLVFLRNHREAIAANGLFHRAHVDVWSAVLLLCDRSRPAQNSSSQRDPEFPIVILGDITAKLCLPRPNGHIDSSRSLCAVWRAECSYNQPDDYVFASIKMHGKQPIWPNSAMEDHIRPAAKRAGITKRIGWHTLRQPRRNAKQNEASSSRLEKWPQMAQIQI